MLDMLSLPFSDCHCNKGGTVFRGFDEVNALMNPDAPISASVTVACACK